MHSRLRAVGTPCSSLPAVLEKSISPNLLQDRCLALIRVFNHKFAVQNLPVVSKFLEIDSKNRDESFCRADKFKMKGTCSPKSVNKKDRLLTIYLAVNPLNDGAQFKYDPKNLDICSQYLCCHFKQLLALLEATYNTV